MLVLGDFCDTQLWGGLRRSDPPVVRRFPNAKDYNTLTSFLEEDPTVHEVVRRPSLEDCMCHYLSGAPCGVYRSSRE